MVFNHAYRNAVCYGPIVPRPGGNVGPFLLYTGVRSGEIRDPGGLIVTKVCKSC